jgi:hypothetical protein
MATLRALRKANSLRQERSTLYEHLACRSDFPPEAHAPPAQDQRPATWHLGAPRIPVPILQIGTVQPDNSPGSFELAVGFVRPVHGGRDEIPFRCTAPERKPTTCPLAFRSPRIPVPILQTGTVQPDNSTGSFELAVGFEPTTCGLRNRCSTAELRQHLKSIASLDCQP